MPEDEKAARRARAQEIRAKAKRVRPTGSAKPDQPPEQEADESPREFVERRMREIDRKKKKSGG